MFTVYINELQTSASCNGYTSSPAPGSKIGTWDFLSSFPDEKTVYLPLVTDQTSQL